MYSSIHLSMGVGERNVILYISRVCPIVCHERSLPWQGRNQLGQCFGAEEVLKATPQHEQRPETLRRVGSCSIFESVMIYIRQRHTQRHASLMMVHTINIPTTYMYIYIYIYVCIIQIWQHLYLLFTTLSSMQVFAGRG